MLGLLATCSIGTAALYTADFSNAGEGLTHSTGTPPPAGPHTVSGTNWELSYATAPSTDSSGNQFITVGGVMSVLDWGGDGTITSDPILVTSDGTVDITGAAVAVGGDVFNSVGTEGITWFYKINTDPVVSIYYGETELGGPVAGGTDIGNLFDDIAVSSGDTLLVGFTVNVNGGGDGADISSLEVELTPVPEPSSAALLGLGGLALILRRRK